MTSFSQRKGLKPIRQALQVDGMDDELRAQLWNVLHFHLWDSKGFLHTDYGEVGRIAEFARALWVRYFKKPFTEIPSWPSQVLSLLKDHYFRVSWNEVYDFLEAVVAIADDRNLEKDINSVLKKELAGYRLINGHFADVTDPKEIAALEEALHHDQFAAVA
ncbi:hypothetical protein MELA_02815 [Candidatus Methylomirabilis lanthanidiphila]|uniref:HEPN AbiJ-N-terminal domain-containing protein n=1 Tax=Candidatus Methylomirabilis lanthanidiphila TaxID=2211376 RepID=A0A564ZP31_9BACT|nr:hypothetical protein [Candidatus Methylomirabilis lanthanidiphila]VUZ86412.1 hypothetical protein MELA_02815 [Candidatus Methylomirabilis lanthanidiphila]